MTLLQIAACVWLAYLLLRLLQVSKILQVKRSYTIGLPASDQLPAGSPSVEVIVPARNEQENISACLLAILAQDYPNFTVTVVNDRSDDDTERIATSLASNDQRLRIHRIETLPDGWTGKAHAMWSAASDSKAEWLLFVDADVIIAESAIRATLLQCERRRVRILTLFGRIPSDVFLLSITMPFLGALLAFWFQPHRINNPQLREEGFVNGQFLLIERKTYENLDGHRSVRDFLIEDVPFGERAKRAGEPIFVGIAPELVTVTMYRDVRGMTKGWARIYAGALRSRFRIGVSALLTAVGFLPYVVAVVIAIRYRLDYPAMLFGALSGVHLFIGTVANWHVWDTAGCKKRDLWFYPVSLGVGLWILALAWRVLDNGVMDWRGTRYRATRNGRIGG